MNTTVRNLIVALPLAAAALTVAPTAAMADDGPVIVLPPPGGDPQGPVIANPAPHPDPDPTGPGDLTAPQPCPTHGVDCGGDSGDGGGDGGNDGNDGGQGGNSGKGGPHQPGATVDSIALPTRIDAGLAPAQADHQGLELTWLLASGALVSASGVAFAARRIRARA